MKRDPKGWQLVLARMLSEMPAAPEIADDKSTSRAVKVDNQENHYRTLPPSARAEARSTKVHGSIMWPGPPARQGGRVSAGLRA